MYLICICKIWLRYSRKSPVKFARSPCTVTTITYLRSWEDYQCWLVRNVGSRIFLGLLFLPFDIVWFGFGVKAFFYIVPENVSVSECRRFSCSPGVCCPNSPACHRRASSYDEVLMEAEVLMLQYAGWTVAVGLDEVRSRLQDLRNRSEASVFIVRVLRDGGILPK